MNDEDLRLVLICAFRYALGRRTYMPGLIARILRQHADLLEPHDWRQIDEDIAIADRRGGLGDECDTKTWRGLRVFAGMRGAL